MGKSRQRRTDETSLAGKLLGNRTLKIELINKGLLMDKTKRGTNFDDITR